ncbi:PhoH family protein [Parapedobacter sp. DT-150]|uniref:PhoH family protein n=1 Tax=Parapedobacter sp. DT-150 TaxID=3396162 RepID=UPI003F1A8952
MNELNITLEYVNPAVLWGAQNEHFEVFKKQFPKLKIVARGNEVKVLGDEQEMSLFKVHFDKIIAHIEQYNHLTPNDVETILGTPKSTGAPAKKAEHAGSTSTAGGEPIVFGPNGIVVKARTANQRRMVESILKNDILFAIGPAGTGKTYTAVALAVRALRNKEVKRIILTRPAVEAGENLGFLPGDLKEKVDPYLRPLYDALDDMIPAEKLKVFLENRTIEVAPLAFMRGRTLDNCFVILDEAQNATDMQTKMFLTRMGPTAKFIVTGDVTQIDLPKKQQSGLQTALKLLDGIEGIDMIYLSGEDVVRHRLVKRILEAYGDI